MTVLLDFDKVLSGLVEKLGNSCYFVLITSENGVVMRSYINDDFNKSSIALNISQLYELAEEITSDVGIQKPDFTIIHSTNFYIISMKLLDSVIILLTEDQVDVKNIFQIINETIAPS